MKRGIVQLLNSAERSAAMHQSKCTLKPADFACYMQGSFITANAFVRKSAMTKHVRKRPSRKSYKKSKQSTFGPVFSRTFKIAKSSERTAACNGYSSMPSDSLSSTEAECSSSIATMSLRPLRIARIRGDGTSSNSLTLYTPPVEAPLAISILTASAWPCCMATNRGLYLGSLKQDVKQGGMIGWLRMSTASAEAAPARDGKTFTRRNHPQAPQHRD